jgi:(p)ppGpp synthase/HD superfamily hydrolase
MASTLEDAIALAARAHRGQRDKSGEPYILHALRVMLRQRDEESRVAAVLHDVVEDTSITLEDLRIAGFSGEVCRAVDCLTRRPEETYEATISRIATNALARRVKIADLEDNMDPARSVNSDRAAAERLSRYQAAWERLRAAGNS